MTDLDAMLRDQFRRRAPVEEALQQLATGKRGPLTQEEAARFAALIGVPDEYRAAPSVVAGEPVAWRYRFNGNWYFCDNEQFARLGRDAEPLYAAPPLVAGEHDDLIRHLRAAEFAMNYIGNPSRAQLFKEAGDGLAAMQAKVGELEHLSEERRVLWRDAQSECVQAGRELKAAQARIAALEAALAKRAIKENEDGGDERVHYYYWGGQEAAKEFLALLNGEPYESPM